jgi:hypothetical protein
MKEACSAAERPSPGFDRHVQMSDERVGRVGATRTIAALAGNAAAALD